MFDILKFGRALAILRKNADMTQIEVADKLNLSRQAISKYERGESFPDISILVMIAELFNVTLDELINYGEPTKGESVILENIAKGNNGFAVEDISDIVNLAPLIKPSVLSKLSDGFKELGVDISNIMILAEYLNDETVVELINTASFDGITEEMLEKFLPLLSNQSKEAIFQKILDGNIDYHFIKSLLPYSEHLVTLIEAAVVAGILPWDVSNILNDFFLNK